MIIVIIMNLLQQSNIVYLFLQLLSNLISASKLFGTSPPIAKQLLASPRFISMVILVPILTQSVSVGCRAACELSENSPRELHGGLRGGAVGQAYVQLFQTSGRLARNETQRATPNPKPHQHCVPFAGE